MRRRSRRTPADVHNATAGVPRGAPCSGFAISSRPRVSSHLRECFYRSERHTFSFVDSDRTGTGPGYTGNADSSEVRPSIGCADSEISVQPETMLTRTDWIVIVGPARISVGCTTASGERNTRVVLPPGATSPGGWPHSMVRPRSRRHPAGVRTCRPVRDRGTGSGWFVRGGMSRFFFARYTGGARRF